MGHRILAGRRGWIGSALLLGTLLTTGVALAFWKISALKADEAAAAHQPEPMEAATAAVASSRAYRPTATSVGTVLALRSITLENDGVPTTWYLTADGTTLATILSSTDNFQVQCERTGRAFAIAESASFLYRR